MRSSLTAFLARRSIRQGRYAAAEAMLEAALSRSPRRAALLEQHALCAHNAGRHAEAAARWRTLLDVAPASAFGLAALAANQRELHRLDDAKETIAAALATHPDDIQVLAEAGRIADRRQDHAEALALWQRLADVPDAPAIWRRSRDRLLVVLGRLDEAESAIEAARTRDPDHHGHLANLTMLRLAQGRWKEAVTTARLLRSRQPEDPAALDLLGQALQGAAFAAAETTGGLHVPVAIERVEDETTRDLLLGFESIGEDCEFGLVQRRYGAEPLGLLRWNWVALPKLLEALASRCEGIGDEAQTDLVVAELGEYQVHDRRYGMKMHTFAYHHQVEPEALRPKMLLRLRYLRDKLVDDLTAAEKVFVYKTHRMETAAMRDLHRALLSYGAIRLLCVVPLDHLDGPPPVGPGEVVRLDEGLHVGFLTRFGGCEGEWRILYDEWVKLCARPELQAR